MDIRDDYTYFFLSRKAAPHQPQQQQPQHQPRIPRPQQNGLASKNSIHLNPFAVLAEESSDKASDSMSSSNEPPGSQRSTGQNPSGFNPFGVLAADSDGNQGKKPQTAVPIRPKAENANPRKRHYVTKHVVSATQHGVQSVKKVAAFSTSERGSSTPQSPSLKTSSAQDDDLDVILGMSILLPTYSNSIGLDANGGPIQERFHHHRRGDYEHDNSVNLFAAADTEIARLRKYMADADYIKATEPSWATRTEYPRPEELMDVAEPWQKIIDGDVALDANIPKGAFLSVPNYLQVHYELYREEAVRPLREAAYFMKANPYSDEPPRTGNFGIYDDVRITGVTVTHMGPAVEVSFSTRRAGKRINWATSSRLTPGSVIMLSCDRFQTVIPAVIASRDEDKLAMNRTDLWFPHPDLLEIDPRKVFIMAEERSTFYEAQRSVMMSLQKMTAETFPLSHLIVNTDVDLNSTPAYVMEEPIMDFSGLYGEEHKSFNVLNSPAALSSMMDDSQEQALMQILTKELAVIQGPPGTGKTFVSVQALKLMLKRWTEGDPPILIACQTNHALDQLLRHLAQETPDLQFARLGGRSKDTGVVQERRMWELRKKLRARHPKAKAVQGDMNRVKRDFLSVLSPLTEARPDHNLLQSHKLLTDAQHKSLDTGEGGWIGLERKSVDPKNPLLVWLGDSAKPVSEPLVSERFSEFEEEILDEETIKERELEGLPDDNWEKLKGEYLPIAQEWCGGPVTMSAADAKKVLQEQNMWRIRKSQRGPLYNYLIDQFKIKLLEKARVVAARYSKAVKDWRVVGAERDIVILKQQQVVGMTTTGLSKFRPLVESLAPKVLLIEEAAETLEAPVVAGCFPSLEQLILVGDHQQLRPAVGIEDLRGHPFYFDLSLFERMVNNGIDYVLLNTQRRMTPEIRSLLHPIYGDQIKDHESVLDRPDVPGMGGLNLFIYTHTEPETIDEYQSTANPAEAEMVAGFYFHLMQNGVKSDRITILTFYNAQRKMIIRNIVRKLRAQADFQDVTEDMENPNVKVVTVDSYQGEENDVVILSMVRSNEDCRIGFAGVENRICVALSRARNGFYVFGNIHMFAYCSQIWTDVREILKAMVGAPRIGDALPTTCTNHGTLVPIKSAEGWDKIRGGCHLKCGEALPCGHPCLLPCHP
jgi:helicase required for RNAi-mediated heterochromatin assembly 1